MRRCRVPGEGADRPLSRSCAALCEREAAGGAPQLPACAERKNARRAPRGPAAGKGGLCGLRSLARAGKLVGMRGAPRTAAEEWD